MELYIQAWYYVIICKLMLVEDHINDLICVNKSIQKDFYFLYAIVRACITVQYDAFFRN